MFDYDFDIYVTSHPPSILNFYTKRMACAVCKTRREKRHCPGVEGEICTVCCGTEREETIDCPLDCEYLQLAHKRENLRKDPAGVPHRDFPIPENFLKKNFQLITLVQYEILRVALESNAIDFDIREALVGLVRTYQTLGSGLYYESRPSNPIAAAIFDRVQQRVAEMRKVENEQRLHKLLDSQLLAVFIFLERLEYAFNNGRKRGRGFMGSLYGALGEFAAPETEPAPSSPLIIS